MKLDELLALAKAVQRDHARRPIEIDEDDGELVTYVRERLAAGILDLLAPAAPCGYDTPVGRRVPASWVGAELSADDLRSLGVMLLRAADEVADG